MRQSHIGHMTGLWFLPARPLRLNTNEWILCQCTNLKLLSPSNTNWTKRNGSSESSPTAACKVHLTGTILVKTLHFKHKLTLRLAHWLPSFIVTCLPIDTLLVTATIVNSALIDISTLKSRAAHHFQSQARCTNIVLQKHRSKHVSRSTTHATRTVTFML